MGWGLVDVISGKVTYVDCGCLEIDKGTSLPDRLMSLYEKVSELVSTYKPDVAAVEELFFSKNVTNGMAVSHARGVIILALAQLKIEVSSYTPNQVKMAVGGWGKADKKQIQQMVKMILSLEKVPKPDDAADALAIALTMQAYRKL